MNDSLMHILAAGGGEKSAPKAEYIPKEGWETIAADLLTFALYSGVLAIILAILCCLWRVLRGPTLIDRGIASDTIAIQVVALVILLTIVSQSLALFDAVLIVSILGFAGTVAFAQYIGRRGAAE